LCKEQAAGQTNGNRFWVSSHELLNRLQYKKFYRQPSLLQNRFFKLVSFAQALAVSQPFGCETCDFQRL